MKWKLGRGKTKSIKDLQGPLRKVIGRYSKNVSPLGSDYPHELLECGHEIARRKNDFGYFTYASRRRCWKCRDRQDVDVPLVTNHI